MVSAWDSWGFFTKAACEALKFVPEVGAFIEGNEIVLSQRKQHWCGCWHSQGVGGPLLSVMLI